ncbi:ABC transporter permease [Actinomadura scrupuli]|uniref:ABC transporter permease n=1 Tax=Actinomadura scrupuli TaxID=559629 RepID=UPI003D971EF1
MKSTLRAADLLPVGTLGLRSRRTRAVLSALGIALGIGAIVGVLGVTRSSQSQLLAQIDRLGTNLLTVTVGHDLSGREGRLPPEAPSMIGRVDGVDHVAPTAQLTGHQVYRSDLIPAGQTGGLAVRACDTTLPATLDGTMRQGRFLNAATVRYPVTVLGAEAAHAMGISRIDPGSRVRLGGHWFTVAGVLNPLPLAPEIDRSALVGFPVAGRLLGYDGHPSRIYVRAAQHRVENVAALLTGTANPAEPQGGATVNRPSDALTARIAVAESYTTLFSVLGAIAVLIGAIGIANVMVISVLERRAEIGLRRALGAARVHVAVQFFTESLVLSALGGIAGVLFGISVTAAMAYLRGWAVLVPGIAVWGGLGIAMLAGTVAGLYPALRASRLSPTDALRTT